MTRPLPRARIGLCFARSRVDGVKALVLLAGCAAFAVSAQSQEVSGPQEGGEPRWNFHAQNTDAVQYHPKFHAAYSGPNSLDKDSEVKETVSADLLLGVRLWRGAEFHADGLIWQGFGLSKTLGVEAFPNSEAFRLGTDKPNFNFPRLFLRQTIGLGGEQEPVGDDPLHLADTRDVSRVTITVGRMSIIDIFDNNTYANDARRQFMNWALVANEAWDYPADRIGFETGGAIELNRPQWTARYGLFQVPRQSNGVGQDHRYLKAWGMVVELERRYQIGDRPGTVRWLAFLNSAHMGSYDAAVDNPTRPADIVATRAYRTKYGFGLNLEQELLPGIGFFTRLGWADGQNEAWAYSDVDYTISLGVGIKGEPWRRPNDTFGVAGVWNGASSIHREFLEAGGTGILAGDGALHYGWEDVLETYYDLQVWNTAHIAIDYQFINNPAFNQDRGPVSVFGARLHWEF